MSRQSAAAATRTSDAVAVSIKPIAAMPTAKLGYSTELLFGNTHEIEILHRGEIYRLRITRQEKLILTK